MRSRLFVAAVVAVLMWNSPAVLACGDKFFIVGRGERFSRAYASVRPGTIVIYTDRAATGGKHLQDAKLFKQMDRAGHRVIAAVGPDDLQRILGANRVDIVLTSDDLAQAVASQIRTLRSSPTLLEVGSAARLKVSDKITRFLDVIEDTMKEREAGGLWRRGA